MVNGHRMAKKSKTRLKNGKESTKVGKELVKRTKNLNKNIETIMGKTAKPKPKTFKFIDSDDIDEVFDVTLTLSDNSTKRYELFRFDLADNLSNDYFVMDLDRGTLKELADFINNYLENN